MRFAALNVPEYFYLETYDEFEAETETGLDPDLIANTSEEVLEKLLAKTEKLGAEFEQEQQELLERAKTRREKRRRRSPLQYQNGDLFNPPVSVTH